MSVRLVHDGNGRRDGLDARRSRQVAVRDRGERAAQGARLHVHHSGVAVRLRPRRRRLADRRAVRDAAALERVRARLGAAALAAHDDRRLPRVHHRRTMGRLVLLTAAVVMAQVLAHHGERFCGRGKYLPTVSGFPKARRSIYLR